ncbi:AMP-binding protein [Amycolatopsis sp. CA-230715]|uniref:AMP-binding protein n=1 Tax=Amycolatopsis sp. CA-230715 TaxID=2745196 RepID=UPI001C02240B|nr:AMP-binding protein [Amycolatopsis sp. CA-230715]QWF83121.1 Bile acid-coenzyme A ligase [Amycolatopsis sp. CA-230715]
MSSYLDIASTRPDRVAVLDPAGRSVTFGDLTRRVHQLAHALRGLGLAEGDGIVAIVHNGIPYYELYLAAWETGLYFTPVNYRSAADEIAYIVANSGARAVFADAEIAASTPLDVPDRFAIGGDVPGWLSYEDFGREQPVTPPPGPKAGQIMLYTSGTTGRPKGVRRPLTGEPPEISELQLAGLAGLGIPPGEGAHLVACPLYHAAPGTFSTGSLHLGHTLVLMDRFDAEETLRLIEKHRITETHLVPTMFHRMLRLPEETKARYDVSSLVSVLHGAAPCPREVKERMIAWFGPVLYEYYGASEGLISTVDTAAWLEAPGTVGAPLPGVEVKVFDDDGNEVPAGTTGTIHYRSAQTNFTYHGDPDKTAANRIGDFVTVGDFGHVDAQGRVFLGDRRGDLILSGGVNIYPAEIEGRLLAHPAVADAAVIGVPDDEWGERVLALVQLSPGAVAGTDLVDELKTHCRTTLAGFKVPKEIEFREQLPRTESGKLLRRTLKHG